MTKLLLIIAAATIAAVSSAHAADMVLKAPPPAVAPVAYTWTGCYVGGNGGIGTGYKDFTDAPGGFIIGNGIGQSITDGIFGGFGGGQIGCDYQFAPTYVIGVRGDLDAANISGSATGIIPEGACGGDCDYGASVNAKISGLFDIVGRVGYVPGTGVLLYIDGGVAWARDSYSIGTCSLFEGECLASASYTQPSETRMGGVVGVGGELNLWGPWSAFAEYDHYFFGTRSLPFSCTSCETTTTQYVNINQALNTWRVGVSYRFGGH